MDSSVSFVNAGSGSSKKEPHHHGRNMLGLWIHKHLVSVPSIYKDSAPAIINCCGAVANLARNNQANHSHAAAGRLAIFLVEMTTSLRLSEVLRLEKCYQ